VSVYVSKNLRQQVRERFNNICVYCQTAELLSASVFEVDHIIPHSADGQTTLDNLCLACSTCNRRKGNRQHAPDPLTNQIVPLFHPIKQKWDDHFSWSTNKTNIVGKTPTGRATIELLKMNRPQLIFLRDMWVFLDKHPPETLQGKS
jgi:5-methylcytosine-specific restriction endonuclease McrA